MKQNRKWHIHAHYLSLLLKRSWNICSTDKLRIYLQTYIVICIHVYGENSNNQIDKRIQAVSYSGKEVSVYGLSQPISIETFPLRSKALSACVNREHVASKHPVSINLVISSSSLQRSHSNRFSWVNGVIDPGIMYAAFVAKH